MSVSTAKQVTLKEPKGLSPRVQWLRDYYFQGAERHWNNEFTVWSTGTPLGSAISGNDVLYRTGSVCFVLGNGSFLQAGGLRCGFAQGLLVLEYPERRAWFLKEVMTNYLPKEILPGDLICGARFNVHVSLCLTKKEQEEYNRLTSGKGGAREQVKWFSRSWIRQLRSHQRSPDTRSRKCADIGMERRPRGVGSLLFCVIPVPRKKDVKAHNCAP